MRRQQAVLDALEMLADDEQAARGQQRVDVGHPAGEAVLARQHGQSGRAGMHRLDRSLEGVAGQRGPARGSHAAGEIGIGAGPALEAIMSVMARLVRASSARARSRSGGVSTPKGA